MAEKIKVVNVSIHVTCLEEDSETVQAQLNDWFCTSDTSLVQRPRVGGIKVSTPRPIERWMRETLCPETLE